MKLREYQLEALEALEADLDNKGNSLVVLPQGSGKSHVIAAYVEKIDQPVVILQPSREILKQNYSKLVKLVPKNTIGIFSASLNQKEVGRITFATIGSVYTRPELFKKPQVLIVDECDLINPRKTNMYKKFIKEAGFKRVIGFTGTPYRMATRTRSWGKQFWQKEVYSVTELINRVWPVFWKRVIYNISTQELIDLGYLAPMRYLDETILDHEKIPVNKSKSDFDMSKYWEEVKDYPIWDRINALEDRFKSILIFAASIDQAEFLQRECFRDKRTAVITHKTNKKDRANIVSEFKRGKIYAVFNVQTLTVGFDHPNLDCIVLNRPTRSIRLYNQMIGRGTRIAEGKDYCTVVDFSGTTKALGPLESFRIEKIEGKWELLSDKGSWHNKELYSFRLPEPPKTPKTTY